MKSNINGRLQQVQQSLEGHKARLVAVSKYYPIDAVLEAYQSGQRLFGESRLQELTTKHQALPSDIEWHFIGHLQTNKVKQLLPLVSLIHGVDSIRLVEEIDRQAERLKIKAKILLQIHIAQEETKYGFSPEELLSWIEEGAMRNYPHIEFCGIMGMASLTDNKDQIRSEFSAIKKLFDKIRTIDGVNSSTFTEISMGMSGDYLLALEEGSTIVRVGSLIFGEE